VNVKIHFFGIENSFINTKSVFLKKKISSSVEKQNKKLEIMDNAEPMQFVQNFRHSS